MHVPLHSYASPAATGVLEARSKLTFLAKVPSGRLTHVPGLVSRRVLTHE